MEFRKDRRKDRSGPILFPLYAADLLELVRRHQLTPHAYADDVQIYGSCRPTEADPLITRLSAGPSRATAGAGKTLSRGPITLPHSVCLEIETPKASRGRKHGERCEVSTHHPTRCSGERRKLTQRDFMHILGQKEAI